MKKKKITIIILLIVGAISWFLIFNKLIKKMTGSTLLQKLVPFIQKWEGGLSRDPHDRASAYPAPWVYNGKSGWHTNKGITFSTFQSNAHKLGYKVSPENFFLMPDALWLKILKNGFMMSYPLHKIDHLPRIQAVIITWAWGSGLYGSERRLANFQREVMGIKDSNITKAEIVEIFNRKITPFNEKMWFEKLCDRRLEDFKRMGTWGAHGRGWTRRLNDFKQTFG